jgi:hypothetical protein
MVETIVFVYSCYSKGYFRQLSTKEACETQWNDLSAECLIGHRVSTTQKHVPGLNPDSSEASMSSIQITGNWKCTCGRTLPRCRNLHCYQTTPLKYQFVNFEFDSNVINVRDLHLEKRDLHTTSTEAEISMVLKPLPANADLSIRCNFEFDSNVTDVSDVQLEKQLLVNTEIDDDIHAR